MAATTTENGDRPVLWPYTIGSMTWPVMPSTITNRPPVQSTIDQPGSTAAASASGSAAAMKEPT